MTTGPFSCGTEHEDRCCFPDRTTMVHETKAWADYRNETAKPINRQFRTEDARIKLKSLYPSFQ
ncbi:MAG: hypothetical protein OXC02_11575 [Rhodobacteraceae bacterium]|nr:hypothetical protein [Paracoccaceae bacterium]